MEFSIFILLLACFILFPDDVKTAYTEQNCIDCCNALPEAYKYECLYACDHRWARSQDYNSRNECIRSCRVKLGPCRQACLDDCTERYVAIPAGVRAPDRRDKERRAEREAREAQGLPGRKPRPTKDPNAPKKKYKPRKKKDDDGEGGSSAVA